MERPFSPTGSETPPRRPSVVGLTAAIGQHLWLIVGTLVLGTLVGTLAASFVPVSYRATATIYLGDTGTSSVFGLGPPVLGPAAAVRATTDLASSPALLRDVADELGGISPREVADRVSVIGDGDVGALVVTADAGSPEEATRTATAHVEVLERTVGERNRAWARRAATELAPLERRLRSRLEEIDRSLTIASAVAAPAITAERAAVFESLLDVQNRIEQVAADAELSGTATVRLDGVEPPTRPVTPPAELIMATGMLFGLLAGVALAWRRVERAPRVRDRRDPGPVLDAPLVGSFDSGSRRPLGAVRSLLASEVPVFGRLRLGGVLEQLATDRRGATPSLQVRGVEPTDDADRAALAIAQEIARTGRRVLVTGRRQDLEASGGRPQDAGAFVVGAGTVRVLAVDGTPASVTADVVVERSASVLGEPGAPFEVDPLHHQAVVLVVNRGCRMASLAEAAETLALEGAELHGYVYIDDVGHAGSRRRPTHRVEDVDATAVTG